MHTALQRPRSRQPHVRSRDPGRWAPRRGQAARAAIRAACGPECGADQRCRNAQLKDRDNGGPGIDEQAEEQSGEPTRNAETKRADDDMAYHERQIAGRRLDLPTDAHGAQFMAEGCTHMLIG